MLEKTILSQLQERKQDLIKQVVESEIENENVDLIVKKVLMIEQKQQLFEIENQLPQLSLIDEFERSIEKIENVINSNLIATKQLTIQKLVSNDNDPVEQQVSLVQRQVSLDP